MSSEREHGRFYWRSEETGSKLAAVTLHMNCPCPHLIALHSSHKFWKRAVLRYLSPKEGMTTTIFLPLFSGREPTAIAALTAAPDEMPQKRPCCERREVKRNELDVLL